MNWFLGCAGAALAVSSIPMKELLNYEAKISRYTVDDEQWQGQGRLRIALVTDFHAGDGIWSGRALARLIKKEDVDLICIGGDFFEPGKSYGEAMTFVEEIGSWRPIYYVSGNHDEGEPHLEGLKAFMAGRYGVHVLDNRNISVRVKGTWVDIFGVRDRGAYKDKNEWLQDVKDSLEDEQGVREQSYHIALCHRPEHKALFNNLEKNLVLSGHTHGGQWRGFKRGVYAPGQGVLPKYTKGPYKCGKKRPYQMVVSAGFAVDKKIPRINNRPELVIVDIKNPHKTL